ncbi:MAG: hypothetical protein IJ571_06100 [Ruminococcus sp.]|nr:hypothetical protein [Ruminococcus sp.]
MTIAEKIRDAFSDEKWADMFTDEHNEVLDAYNGTNSALLNSETYAEATKVIDSIMQENGVSEYQINSTLREIYGGECHIATYTVTYLEDGLQTVSFKIESYN